jgi:hypothetical protein
MRPNTTMLMLPLDLLEAQTVTDALVLYATYVEGEGDSGSAAIADAIHERTKALNTITTESFSEWVRFIGLGRAQDRPQG